MGSIDTGASQVSNLMAPMLMNGTLRKGLLEAAKSLPILTKMDNNPEGWSFVSIDSYYEYGARALLDQGISWTCTEVGFEPISHGGAALFGFRFQFDFYSAEEYWPNVMRVTVLHEMEGPQTTGKVVSYAEKVCLRAVLKMVTGEADADSSPTRPRRIAAAAKSDVKTAVVASTEHNYTGIAAEMRAAKTAAALDAVSKKNKESILFGKKNDPEEYAKLMKIFTDRKKEFEDAKQAG